MYVIGLSQGVGAQAVMIAAQMKPEANAETVIDFARNITPFCTPDNSNYRQMVDVVSSFLTNRPEQRHEDASVLVIKALREAFPCN